jgi:hypothetical protein
VREPEGLLMENFRRHSSIDFEANRHVKTIMRKGESAEMQNCHVFNTPHGTFDGKMRPVSGGLTEFEPSYDAFRINHYVTQSYAYFKNVKQGLGVADNEVHVVKPDSYFFKHDRNECDDGVSYNFLVPLKLKVMELQEALQS